MSEQARKHQRVAGIIGREIRAGALRTGSRLPGEHALTERFSVSRATVREALRALSDEGLISTHAGIGSFVTFDGTPLNNRHGWTQALVDQGASPTTTVLRLGIVEDRELAAELALATARFVALDRVRALRGGARVSLERSRVPLCRGLERVPEQGLIEGSLTRTLAQAGLVVASGEQRASAVPLCPEDAEILGRPEGTSFLRVRRTGCTADGQLAEHVISLLDPDRFELRTRFGHPEGP